MPTIIAIHPTGYEVRFEVDLAKVNDLIQKLEKRRYRPSRELAYTAEGLPICPRHGVPMARREKQGDIWYSHKVTAPETGQVIYCRGYAGPSSPGFDIPAQSARPESQQNPTTHGHASHGRAPIHPRSINADVGTLNEALFG